MNLLEPITIRGVEFKNRMVMPPMQVGVGLRSPRARGYYLERAKGGVGTIIMAGTSVDLFATDDAWGRLGGVDAFLNGIRPLIDDVHQAGVRIGIQLWHGNRFPAGTGAAPRGWWCSTPGPERRRARPAAHPTAPHRSRPHSHRLGCGGRID